MVYENFLKLCKEKGKKKTSVLSSLGISYNTFMNWNKGVVPHDSTLKVIAKEFDVPTRSLKIGPIAYKLEKIIEHNNMDISDFMAVLGISIELYNNWLSGTEDCYEYGDAISDYLQVDKEWLCSYRDINESWELEFMYQTKINEDILSSLWDEPMSIIVNIDKMLYILRPNFKDEEKASQDFDKMYNVIKMINVMDFEETAIEKEWEAFQNRRLNYGEDECDKLLLSLDNFSKVVKDKNLSDRMNSFRTALTSYKKTLNAKKNSQAHSGLNHSAMKYRIIKYNLNRSKPYAKWQKKNASDIVQKRKRTSD